MAQEIETREKFWKDLNFFQSDDMSTLYVDINGIQISNSNQIELLALGTEKNFIFHIDSNRAIILTGDIEISCRFLNILFDKKDDQITPALFFKHLKHNSNQQKRLRMQEIKSHLFPSRISTNVSWDNTRFIEDENVKQKILQYLKEKMNFSHQDIRSISFVSID